MARTLICRDLDRPDMVSAVKALLLVNEQLESELQQLYAAAAYRSPTKRQAKLLLH